MFFCCMSSTCQTVAAVFLMVYLSIPILVKLNPWILNKVLFLHFIKFPFLAHLEHPEKKGMVGTRNFYITVNKDVKLGVWHVLPKSLSEKKIKDYDKLLKSGHPVVLYLHGNSHSRGQSHRVELYKILSAMDFHVIAVDYRGFGDSSGIPSEQGVFEDSYTTYKWIKERCADAPFYIWGHSLGTAISTSLVKHLNKSGEYIDGLILESPFNNLKDAALHHPISLPFRYLPWFNWAFIDTIKEAGINFNTDESIKDIREPVLILHAKDDHVIPIKCGYKLHEAFVQSRDGKTDTIHLQIFERNLGYRHNNIYLAPELPNIVRNFMKICSEK